MTPPSPAGDTVSPSPSPSTSPSTSASSRRASPLPPHERREAILEAVLPVLLEHGRHATSRQLAAAAGVSEGTVFKVFNDKDALFAAALDRALDADSIQTALAGIDTELDLASQLLQATELIQRRIVDVWRLVSQLHPEGTRGPRPRPLTDSPVLTALLATSSDELRVDPERAAMLLRALTLSLSHPMLVAEPRPAAEIVDLFFHGVRRLP